MNRRNFLKLGALVAALVTVELVASELDLEPP
jgi:hypothetical protein